MVGKFNFLAWYNFFKLKIRQYKDDFGFRIVDFGLFCSGESRQIRNYDDFGFRIGDFGLFCIDENYQIRNNITTYFFLKFLNTIRQY